MIWAEGGLVEPEVVLPPQFFGTLRRQAPVKTGEFRLLIALLEDAVHCFQKHALARDRTGQRLFREAEEWMMAEGGDAKVREGPTFSFHYVCEVLGLDEEGVRRALRSGAHAGASPSRAGTSCATRQVRHTGARKLPRRRSTAGSAKRKKEVQVQ